ncbi:MAG: hypothetical protein CME63_18370 [Halobacteriovoraceae bacterium]|nr:hypothetical protein [Halobacteriovoraceae bacterium]|tara:strand:+ start:4258 stop:4989 length:732 start_codon:yes stop_codon:yes gene_type:complete
MRIIFFFLVLINSYLCYGQVKPQDKNSFDQEFNFSSFYKLSDGHQLYFNYTYLSQAEQFQQRLATLSYRYTLHRNWRVGILFKRAYGLRHNEDWNKDSGPWAWKDTSDRSEHLTSAFLQHKQIAWGKGRGILKNRLSLQRNWFNDQDTLFYKAGILNFEFQNWTTLHQFELAIPLNYNRSFISELWHYSAFLYQYNTILQFGPSFTIGKMFWNESIDFNSRNGNEFEQSILIYRLGLSIILAL